MSTYTFSVGKKVQATTNRGSIFVGKIVEIRTGKRGDWYGVKNAEDDTVTYVRASGLARL